MRTILFFLLFVLCSTFAFAQVPKGHTIWESMRYSYDYTDEGFARDWESTSLPLGNGSLGANVMGYVGTEVYTLNEKSLWTGGPASAGGPAVYWNANKESAAVLKEIRRAFKAGDTERAQQLTADNFDGLVPAGSSALGHYASLGRLTLDTGHKLGKDSRYAYALSLDSAFAHVFYTLGGIEYERRSFISYPDNVLVIRCTASYPGLQTMRIAYQPGGESVGATEFDGSDGLVFRGKLQGNGMAYVVRIRVIIHGGKITTSSEAPVPGLNVKDADEVLILLTADTDYAPAADLDFSNAKAYVGVDPDKTTARWIKAAAKKTYDKLFAAHLKDYKALYDRVELHVATTPKPASTESRPRGTIPSVSTPFSETRSSLCLYGYRHSNSGMRDHGFEEHYFQYGRYLLIASSRGGNLPANNCGLWSLGNEAEAKGSLAAAGYSHNGDLQMLYWPALTCNLAECQQPLFDYVRSLQKSGAVTAKKYFNARGWTTGATGNPFGFTAPLADQDPAMGFNPVAGAWLATHLWEHFAFTRDAAFLRNEAYPVLKGCADFCSDYLWQKDDGTLTAAPSVSLGHGPVDEGTAYAHGVCREILGETIAAADILKTNHDEAFVWSNVMTSLAPYKVGRHGQLQEWSRDIDAQTPTSSLFSPSSLFGLHPGSGISPLTVPDLAAVARVSLEQCPDSINLELDPNGTSAAWRLNQWARLRDGERSYRTLCDILCAGNDEEHFYALLPPVSVATHCAATAGIAEMLLQSHADCIDLLPAIPATWGEGSVKGLCARGGFIVDISWSEGTLTEATVTSLAGETCPLRYGEDMLEFKTAPGKTYHIVWFNGYLKMQ
ncbi:MAG: glycoside hydrolase family 95 protein [Bacteroidales bacterium]|nr:glycoside hydrolase family 95 protein [Bacteroidales bacterium]